MSRVSRKEDEFYDMFRDFSQRVVTAGDAYYKLVSDWENSQHLVAQMSGFEAECDQAAGRIFDELNKSFITPFDREDVGALIGFLDATIDGMEGVSVRFQLYDVQRMIPEAVKMAELTRDATHELEVLFEHLPKFRKDPAVLEQVNKVRSLEDQADVVYRNGLAELFKKATDPFFVMKWKSLLDKMEDTIDRCKDVCTVIQDVVIKNG